MTDHQLTITISNDRQRAIEDPYWLRIEVEAETSAMTVGEAAAVIDELYHIEPCGESGSVDAQPQEPDPQDQQDQLDQQDQQDQQDPAAEQTPTAEDWDRALALINAPGCDQYLSDDNGYDATIRVYQSHQDEPYKLVLSNGTITRTRREIDTVNAVVDPGGGSITLDRPVTGGFRATWTSGHGPTIQRTGNTLYWTGDPAGRLRVQYDTVYDLVDVRVTPGPAETQESGSWGEGWTDTDDAGDQLTCQVLAFYHRQAYGATINPPPRDTNADETTINAVCNQSGTIILRDDLGDLECYKRVRHRKKCVCTGEDADSEVEQVAVPCPPGYKAGSDINGGVVEESDDATYVSCGHTDDVAETDYYRDTCCADPGFVLPSCRRRYGPYSGKTMDDQTRADLLRQYGDDARIIVVGPRSGSCGETIIEQRVQARNCCDDIVQDLAYDDDNSVDTISPGNDGAIYVTGGTLPLQVSVRGLGFYLDKNRTIRDATIDHRDFIVYTTSDACGYCWIRITDGCTSVNGGIFSTQGNWRYTGRCYQSDCTWNLASMRYKYLYFGNERLTLGFWSTFCTCSQIYGDRPCEYGKLYSEAELADMEGDYIPCNCLANSWSSDCCKGDLCRLCPQQILRHLWVCW